MHPSFISAAVVVALSAVVPVAAHAVTITYFANLSGASESPVNTSLGTGTATVIVDTTASTMEVIVSFSGLNATTGAGVPSGVTASHIHCCTAAALAGTAGVATPTPTFPGFPSGVLTGSYDQTFDMTLAASYNAAAGQFLAARGNNTTTAFNDLVAGLDAGKAYLNIHTTAFPGGEIRGFLQPVPEPQTCAMLLAGLGAVGSLVRRRRRA